MDKKHSVVIPISLGMVSTFIIKGEKTILVDTGYKGSEDKILKKMQEEGINPDELSLILLTHGHDDHFGSANILREKTGAPIAIHKYDADNIRKGCNGKLSPTGRAGKVVSLFMGSGGKSKVKGFDPDIVIDDLFDLEEYGIKGKVISTPGHTKGSISVALDGGEIIIGDLMMAFFKKKRPGYPVWADDILKVKHSIQEVVKMEPKIIYASHGGPFTLEAVQEKFEI